MVLWEIPEKYRKYRRRSWWIGAKTIASRAVRPKKKPPASNDLCRRAVGQGGILGALDRGDMAMALVAATARDVARQYGQAKGIRFLPEDNAFCAPDGRKILRHILFADLCSHIGKGNGSKARAAMLEMERLFSVPRRLASPGILAEWMRACEAFAAQAGGSRPDEWPEARVSATSKVGTLVLAPSNRLPRVRLYVTASPYWSGLRAGESEPRPGRQNCPA